MEMACFIDECRKGGSYKGDTLINIGKGLEKGGGWRRRFFEFGGEGEEFDRVVVKLSLFPMTDNHALLTRPQPPA